MKLVAQIVFVYIFVLGLVFTFFVPPLQKPDEHGHFLRSILLAHGKITLTEKDVKLPIEKQYYDLIHDPHLNRIPYKPQNKFDIRWYDKPIFATYNAYKLVQEDTWGQFMLPAFSYLPHTAGIIIGRTLNLNAYLTFFTGRFTMFLFAFLWMIFLYKKTPVIYKPILLFVFSIPMVLHQISAYSYDSMQYMTGFTLFTVFLLLLQKKKILNFDLLILTLAFIIFLITKLSFEPMLLLLLAIPAKRISPDFRRYTKKILIVFGLIILAYFSLKSSFYFSASRYKHHPPGINPTAQTMNIIRKPIQYAKIMTTSSVHLLKFHLQGMIGIFGWLDYSMDLWIYAVYIAIGLFVVYQAKLDRKDMLSTQQILMVIAAISLTYFLIMTVFYLNWKPVGASEIDGTQGRYFITLLPFAVFAFIQSKYNKTIQGCFLILMIFLILVSIVTKIQLRYYSNGSLAYPIRLQQA